MSSTTQALIYLSAFVGPFIQEDAAIIAGVTAFLHPEINKMASPALILGSMFFGLVVSDLWKYWIGAAGRNHSWAKVMAQKPAVEAVGQKIVSYPGKTLMLARFIPGTRIPAYIAAGFFGVSFARFSFWIVASAAAYVGVALLVLRTIGEVAGMKGQLYVGVSLMVIICVWIGSKVVKKAISQKPKTNSSTTP